MGQLPEPSPSPPSLPSSSSLSTHSIAAEEELPPAYDQSFNANNNPTIPETSYLIPGSKRYNSILQRKRHGGIVTLDPDLSLDGAALEDFINAQTRLPPRPCLIISGYHRETHRTGNNSNNNNRKTETKTVSDFDFRIDLTSTLLRWGPDHTGRNQEWAYTAVVGDHDGAKAYRGGRWKTRSRNPGRIALPEDDEGEGPGGEGEGERLMDLEGGEDAPGIKGWCHRFTRDRAAVKSFTYRRNLTGFEVAPMRASFISHIRSTGYRGHISVQPSLSSSEITVYSPHWINRLRNNTFVFWACIVSQLWLITWPVIWLLERRYDVVRSEWYTCKEVCDPATRRVQKVYAGGFDEARAAEIWAPVVREAAWGRCTAGSLLGEAEIVRLGQLARQRDRAAREQGGGLISRGQAVLGMMGIREVAGVDVTGTWGGDTDYSREGGSRFSVRFG